MNHPPTETKDAQNLEEGDAIINIGMVKSVQVARTNGLKPRAWCTITLESGELIRDLPERRFVVFKRNKAFEQHVRDDMAYFATLPAGATGPTGVRGG